LDVVPKLTVDDAEGILEEYAGVKLVKRERNREEEDVDAAADGPSTVDSLDEIVFQRVEIDKGQGRRRRNDNDEALAMEVEVLDLCQPQLQILTLDNNDDAMEGGRYLKGKTNKRRRKKKHSILRTTRRKKKGESSATAEDEVVSEEVTFTIGQGYKHALVWRICPKFVGQKQEIMEGMVDAHTGQVYSFVDRVDYFSGVGGVYPVSNDGRDPDGVPNQDWPVPYAYVTDAADGMVAETDTGGHYWSAGNKTSTFRGRYVHMNDTCGAARLEFGGDFDWGGAGGTDCDTPGYGGAGNTMASRSGYYELNRIMEIARSHLPGNNWLKERLTANMNFNDSCNAFWNGQTVNFYRSNNVCGNSGEIAGVFDHEWCV
jgi:hypothetical protein